MSDTREPQYKQDLEYIHAAGFGGLAQGAAPEIIRMLKCAPVRIRRVVDVGLRSGNFNRSAHRYRF